MKDEKKTKTLTETYVALGSNLGDSAAILQQALESLAVHPKIHNLIASKFYRTTPVSDIPQSNFVNAVCRFNTSLSAHDLLKLLQLVEMTIGKVSKPKNAPRLIDLDLLLFGMETIYTKELIIPHPHWKNRLFVLIPLADLITDLQYPNEEGAISQINLPEYIKNFPNPNKEVIIQF